MYICVVWSSLAVTTRLLSGGSSLLDSPPLDNSVKAIHARYCDRFSPTIRPENLQLVYVVRAAETKVNAQVALRNVASAGSDFRSLAEAPGGAEGHAANRVARRFPPRV